MYIEVKRNVEICISYLHCAVIKCPRGIGVDWKMGIGRRRIKLLGRPESCVQASKDGDKHYE